MLKRKCGVIKFAGMEWAYTYTQTLAPTRFAPAQSEEFNIVSVKYKGDDVTEDVRNIVGYCGDWDGFQDKMMAEWQKGYVNDVEI